MGLVWICTSSADRGALYDSCIFFETAAYWVWLALSQWPCHTTLVILLCVRNSCTIPKKAWITGLFLLCLFYWSKTNLSIVGKYFYRHKILFVLMRSREINLSLCSHVKSIRMGHLFFHNVDHGAISEFHVSI